MCPSVCLCTLTYVRSNGGGRVTVAPSTASESAVRALRTVVTRRWRRTRGGGLILLARGCGHVLSRSPCSSNSNASTAIRAATHPGRAQLLHPSAVNGCRSASCLARSPISRNCTASSHTSTRGLLSSGPPHAGSRRSETGAGDATPGRQARQPPTAANILNLPGARSRG